MRAVPRENTAPEIVVRRLLQADGFRYRLHRKDLPGTPDIVLPRYRVVIFAHGCFWHRHRDCSKATMPKARAEFWQAKFDRNVQRDADNEAKLRALGWRVIIVWECDSEHPAKLLKRLRAELPR
jgi:DNA mismatch endonuclease, patch repair protein